MGEDGNDLSLGELIRRQRQFAELPMRQFAAMVGISIPYLSQIERGLRAPSQQVLEGIAQTLQTSVDELSAAAGSAHRDHAEAFERVIRDDPDLTTRQRQALVEVYGAMTAATTGRRSTHRHATDGSE